MKRSWILICLIIVMGLQTSCSDKIGTTSPDIFQGIDLPIEEMNVALTLKNVSAGRYKQGDLLAVQLKNSSEKEIVFSGNSDIKIFAKQKQSWIPVQNNFYYTGDGYILPPFETYPPGVVVALNPYFSGSDNITAIRVFVIGHFKDNGDTVAAYIDIVLFP